jgi:hypothetical protein
MDPHYRRSLIRALAVLRAMSDFITALPNLSIGVVAVLGLVYVSLRHNQALDKQREDFLSALGKQQESFRELETSVRASLTEQLTKNTLALSETAQVLARVIRHLDK